jgi:hypothetical protein
VHDSLWMGNSRLVWGTSLPPLGTLAASDRTILSEVVAGCSPVAVTVTGVRVSRRKDRVAALVVPSFLIAGLFWKVAQR